MNAKYTNNSANRTNTVLLYNRLSVSFYQPISRDRSGLGRIPPKVSRNAEANFF